MAEGRHREQTVHDRAGSMQQATDIPFPFVLSRSQGLKVVPVIPRVGLPISHTQNYVISNQPTNLVLYTLNPSVTFPRSSQLQKAPPKVALMRHLGTTHNVVVCN